MAGPAPTGILSLLGNALTGPPSTNQPPTPQQTAALNGQPDPGVQTGVPIGPHYNPLTGAPSSVAGTPGISGAIKDLMTALSAAFAPKSLTQRGQKLDQTIGQASGGNPTGGNLGDQF